MKAVLQIVKSAALTVDGKIVSEIEKGLSIYLGIHVSDTKEKAQALAKKIAGLRIFADENRKINLNVKQAGNNALVVSNFTLNADTTRGNRPNFSYAMEPSQAEEVYHCFVETLKQEGLNVKTGVFGAHMQINQVNLGPVNVVLDA